MTNRQHPHVCRLWIVMWLWPGSSITAMLQTGVLNAPVMNDTVRSFIFCTKASRPDTTKATIAPFVPGVGPIFVVVMAVVAHMQAKHVFIESSRPSHVRDRIDREGC